MQIFKRFFTGPYFTIKQCYSWQWSDSACSTLWHFKSVIFRYSDNPCIHSRQAIKIHFHTNSKISTGASSHTTKENQYCCKILIFIRHIVNQSKINMSVINWSQCCITWNKHWLFCWDHSYFLLCRNIVPVIVVTL